VSSPYEQVPPHGGGWGYAPPPPKRPWYKVPGTLAGAATVSAMCAWATVAAALTGLWLVHELDRLGFFEALILGLFVLAGLVIAWIAGVTAFCLSVAGAVVTIPLAIVWFRDPHRTPGDGLALAHAVVAWAAMAVAIVWLA